MKNGRHLLAMGIFYSKINFGARSGLLLFTTELRSNGQRVSLRFIVCDRAFCKLNSPASCYHFILTSYASIVDNTASFL